MTLPNVLRSKTNKLPRPSVALFVCLLVSAMGWVVITFSREYKVTLNYRVNCVDLPKGKQAIVSDSIFSLTFNTRGLNYLNPKFSGKNRVISLSIKDLTAHKKKSNPYNFTPKELNDYIGNNYFNGTEFVGVENITSWSVFLD
ncbi:MAG: hypothetical protein LBV46_02725 [Bacteroidales bacterium]|jgi:hypothetical protein|nr:hypothetical protein [Bacteroidales bacterium]